MMEKQQRENNRWGSEIQDYWMEIIDSKKSQNGMYKLNWEFLFIKIRKTWIGNIIFQIYDKNEKPLSKIKPMDLIDKNFVKIEKQTVNLTIDIKQKYIYVKAILQCRNCNELIKEMLIRINHGLKMKTALVNGRECEFYEVDDCNNAIKIIFNQHILKNEKYEIALEYCGVPIMRKPSFWGENTFAFSEESMVLPCCNLFPKDWYNLTLSVNTRRNIDLISNGERVTYRNWYNQYKNSGICLIGGKFNTLLYKNKKCNVWIYYTDIFKSKLKYLENELEKLIWYYSMLFGEFPWKQIKLICSMEIPICFINGDCIVLNRMDKLAMSHEMAHIWWGGCIKGNGPEWKMFHEGFAELFSDIYMCIESKLQENDIEKLIDEYLKLESSINEKNHDLIYHVSCEVDENEIENYKLYILQIVGKVGVKVFLQRARYIIRRYMFSNVDVEYVWDTLRYGEKENNSN